MFSRVSILCDPKDYDSFLSSYSEKKQIPASLRNNLALKAFTMTAQYDTAISNYFRKQYASADGIDNAPPEDKASLRESVKQLTLRYGINPHQKPAQAYVQTGKLPFSGMCSSLDRTNLADRKLLQFYPDRLATSTFLMPSTRSHSSRSSVKPFLPLFPPPLPSSTSLQQV